MASGYRKKGDDDVWDWNIYDSKGDRFSRGKNPKPRVYKTGRRMDGSSYIRRIRTDEAKCLDIAVLVKDLKAFFKREGTPEKLEQRVMRVWHWNPHTNALSYDVKPSTVPLEVSLTRPQFGGARFWWRCPRCAGRCARLYAVMVLGLPYTGCWACLGLTYPSQAKHKTRAYDRALQGWKVGTRTGVSTKARLEASKREAKRELRFVWQLDKLMGSSFSLGLEAQALNEARKSVAFNRALEGKGRYDSQKFAPRWKDVVRVYGFDEP